jgi:hypothetical protein
MFRGRRDFQWFRRSHRRVNHPDNNMLQPPGLLAAHIGLLAPGPWQDTNPAWLKKIAQRPVAIGVPIGQWRSSGFVNIAENRRFWPAPVVDPPIDG